MPRVVVSIGPQAWLVNQIGGRRVEVMTLVKPGQSPATYQPTDQQVSQVMDAGVYFRIGVPFEEGRWFEAIRQSRKLKIIDTRDGIKLRNMRHHAHHHEAVLDHRDETGADHRANHDEYRRHTGHDHAKTNHQSGLDPHIWLCPRLLKVQARTICNALKQLAPGHDMDYERNLQILESRLDDLDREIRQILADCIDQRQPFFVFHPAWGYFAEEYDLEQVAIEHEGKEPTDHELTALQQRARKEGIGVVFVQPQIAGRSAQAVADAIQGRVVQLDPLAQDVPENLRRVATAIATSGLVFQSDDDSPP